MTEEEFEKAIEMWDRITTRNIVNGYTLGTYSRYKVPYLHPSMTPSQLYASKKIAEILEDTPFENLTSKVIRVDCVNEDGCRCYDMTIEFTVKNSHGEFIDKRHLDFHCFNHFFIDINLLIDKISEKCKKEKVDDSFCEKMRDWIDKVKKKIILPAKLLMDPLTDRNLRRIKAFEKRQEVIEVIEYKITHSKFGEMLQYTNFFNERRSFLEEKYLPERFKA